MYKVIHEFLDLQDNSYHYKVGDVYPREGMKTSLERETALLGNGNKIGVPLIEEIEEIEEKPIEEKPKRTRTTRK